MAKDDPKLAKEEKRAAIQAARDAVKRGADPVATSDKVSKFLNRNK